MKLYYEDIGQGEVVLLLHGFTGFSGDWLPLLPLLPKDFRYLIPDLSGHGRSPNAHQTYTHKETSIAIYQLLDDLGIQQFKACGVSGGAMALLHMATQQPLRVESMILVSPTTHYTDQARAIMGAVDLENIPQDDWNAMRKKHPGGTTQIQELWRLSRAFKDDYTDMNFQPADLQTIQASTFIVHGECDPLIPNEIAETIERYIPDSFLWSIASEGHVPVFGDQLTEFFHRASNFLTTGKKES
ncbi:MAG: alpha/beta hydrolase [Verrucomicrobiota bacterium]